MQLDVRSAKNYTINKTVSFLPIRWMAKRIQRSFSKKEVVSSKEYSKRKRKKTNSS